MCVDTLQNRAQFSKTIDLIQHEVYLTNDMPRFTSKMNIFPSIFLETPCTCVLIPSEQGSFFQDQLIWGVTCLGFTIKMNDFPIYLLGNPINVCSNHQNRSHFSQDRLIWRVTCLGVLWKNEHFFIYLLGNSINVCWNTWEQCSIFQDDWFEGSHA